MQFFNFKQLTVFHTQFSTCVILQIKAKDSTFFIWPIISGTKDKTCAVTDHQVVTPLLLWLPYGIGQTIIFLPCGFYLSFFLLSFFSLPNLKWSTNGCLPYFHTWCGLSANLECMSEMCCTWLVENTGRKNLPSRHHRTTLSGHIFATKACIDNLKKTC